MNEIPPTAVGGSFKSNLQTARLSLNEIPPTAVGGSFKSNLQAAQHTERNPPDGSRGIFQVLPTIAEAGPEQSTHFRGWDSIQGAEFTVGCN